VLLADLIPNLESLASRLKMFKRKELKKHPKEDSEDMNWDGIVCEYGCLEPIPSSLYEKHLKDSVHLHLAMVKKSQTEMNEMKQQIASAPSNDGPRPFPSAPPLQYQNIPAPQFASLANLSQFQKTKRNPAKPNQNMMHQFEAFLHGLSSAFSNWMSQSNINSVEDAFRICQQAFENSFGSSAVPFVIKICMGICLLWFLSGPVLFVLRFMSLLFVIFCIHRYLAGTRFFQQEETKSFGYGVFLLYILYLMIVSL